MKNCPYCAEEIQDKAIKCRYCRELIGVALKVESDDNRTDRPLFKNESKAAILSRWIIGILILWILAFCISALCSSMLEITEYQLWCALIFLFIAAVALIFIIASYYKIHKKDIFNKECVDKIIWKINNMKINNFLQIAVLIILAGIVFYMVYPKYYLKNPHMKINKITGKTYIFDNSQDKWMQR